jgi:hypothetical protein
LGATVLPCSPRILTVSDSLNNIPKTVFILPKKKERKKEKKETDRKGWKEEKN